MSKKNVLSLVMCYVLWGFQPLYWSFLGKVDSFTILACRIILAAVFSVVLLAVSKRLSELKAMLTDRKKMKILLPAVVFLLADWAVFIVVVNSGHVLDASLGYCINPLVLFALGLIFYKEKCTRMQILALCLAAAGIVVSTAAFGSFPYISLIIAINWAVYAALKRNIKDDGVVSIAAETLILTPFALAFLLIFRQPELMSLTAAQSAFLLGSGVVTALPMFLFSNSVKKFSLIFMCFAQYLSPTFNAICGYIMGESFTKSQLVSLLFFVSAIAVFTVSEVRRNKFSSKLS